MNAFYSDRKKKETRTFYVKEIKQNESLFRCDKLLVLESIDALTIKEVPDHLKEILGGNTICTGMKPISIEIYEIDFVREFGQDKYNELMKNKIIDLEVER